MRFLSSSWGIAALLAVAGASFLTTSASATVLTFDMGVTSGTSVISTYGDRVGLANPGLFTYGSAGGLTPNVVVEYQPTLIFSNDPVYKFGDLNGILYRRADNTDNIIEILFTADPGYMICLTSFDLAARVNFLTNPPQQEDLPAKAIRVETGPGLVLYSKNWTAVNPDPLVIIPGSLPLRHNTYDFSSAPLSAQQIRIVVDLNLIPNKTDKFGIDNVVFSQCAVPSPGPSALLAGSLFATGLRRRRR